MTMRTDGRRSELSPVSLVQRAATAFSSAVVIEDAGRSWTFLEHVDRAMRLASSLESVGVSAGDRVAVLCSNSHIMLEAHTAVPAVPAVLVPLNTRLSLEEHRYQLRHAEVRCLIATREHAERAAALAADLGIALLLEGDDYERAIASGSAEERAVASEDDVVSISYTSGTTGHPKGVMQTHRAALLQAQAMIVHGALGPRTRYLWTLPMFHCHGWANTWAVTAAGGTHVCDRVFEPAATWDLIDRGITHVSAAPTVITMLLGARPHDFQVSRAVSVMMGGAPPSPALVGRMQRAGLTPHHLYGLTETLGPSLVNIWRPEWDELPADQRARLHARQGVPTLPIVGVRIVDESGSEVPADGVSSGELWLRGETVTAGYYRDEGATRTAVVDGWLRTGDAAVRHADGYIEITDRLKDVIVTGGENVSSVEVERVIDAFPGIVESAVVGEAHPLWGEQVVAFIDGVADVDTEALTDHVRQHLAGFKVPRRFIRAALPKTATGKIRKDVLRDRVSAAASDTKEGTSG